jgi:hypothetical protein
VTARAKRSKLPPTVEEKVRRILAREARRLLVERQARATGVRR